MNAPHLPRRALTMLAAAATMTIAGCSDAEEVPNPARYTNEELVLESEVIFVGTTRSTEELESGETRAVVEVTDVLKGEVSGDVVEVVAPEGIDVTDIEQHREALDTDENPSGLWFATGDDPYLLLPETRDGYPMPGDQLPDFFRTLVEQLSDAEP